MSRLRTRLDRLDLADHGPRPVRFIDQRAHPDGRRLPSDEDLDRQVKASEADGFRVLVMRTVYTQHSLNNGWGPAEWAPSQHPNP